MKPTSLLVGLGNPGTKYAKTRHNVGWWFIDCIHKQYNGDDWKLDKKHQALLSRVIILEKKEVAARIMACETLSRNLESIFHVYALA